MDSGSRQDCQQTTSAIESERPNSKADRQHEHDKNVDQGLLPDESAPRSRKKLEKPYRDDRTGGAQGRQRMTVIPEDNGPDAKRGCRPTTTASNSRAENQKQPVLGRKSKLAFLHRTRVGSGLGSLDGLALHVERRRHPMLPRKHLKTPQKHRGRNALKVSSCMDGSAFPWPHFMAYSFAGQDWRGL